MVNVISIIRPIGFLLLLVFATALRERIGWGWVSALMVLGACLIFWAVESFSSWYEPPDSGYV